MANPGQIPQSGATYTAHTATSTAVSGALVAIGAWVLSLYQITVPSEIVAAAVVVVTPITSIIMKAMGLFSD